MLFLQNIIKFFINGSTSQATITMPIMAPTAELVGLSKQIAVLAYQFGNGFADCFWPTSCALCCGLMGGVPAEQVVPLRHPAVPDDAGPGVCIHDHRRLDRLLKDAFAPVPG